MITVVIPAYNEGKHIADVVRKASEYADYVVVVDNNSSDDTYQVASDAGAMVVSEQIQGAGAATRKGFRVAQELLSDIVVTIDGDGQHCPLDIPRVVAPIVRGEADIVLGSRFLEQNLVPTYRAFGIRVITFCCGPLTDAQCGLRAFSSLALHVMTFEEKGYGIVIEQIIKARGLALRIKEVPVQCFYRGLKSDSSMNPVKQGLLTLWYVLKWRIRLGV